MALRQFQDIPAERPRTPLLDRINTPDDVRALSRRQLPDLANELRAFLLYTVGQTGGHFGAGLGVIELTIALHYCFQTPEDRLVWDVGHQTYPHKILTGRRKQMRSLRQKDGIAAFPKREESPFDAFGVGHSSTSISAALGMALVAKQKGEKRRNIAVIGDGAMSAGMAFEALNHAAQERANLLVILNDNDMSISGSTGGLSRYLTRVLTSELYTSVRESGKRLLHGLPRTRELVRKTEEYAKGMITPTASTFFEELGFNYIGPVNGHDLPSLVQTLEAIKDFEGPWFLHVLTQKGKGFTPAEEDPIGYHAIGKHSSVKSPANSPAAPAKKPTYSNVFGQWLCDMAKVDARLNGITPAMREGSDLVRFSEEFPDRYHDVAIAEQHAITLAAGMACEGYKPVVAIYSTFLQRGYDQLIHDVALQDLDVLFAIDRAGLVGEDGPTHAGVYDLSFLRCVPNMVVMAPSDEAETRLLLNTGYHHHGPAAVRYPRGTGSGLPAGDSLDTIPLGKARVLREGKGLAILAFGSLTTPARKVADALDATLVDMRFVKPLDEALVLDMATRHLQLVTLEENTLAGGAGAAVLELLARARIQTPVHCLGLPDRVIEHGKPDELLSACGLDATGIEKSIRTHCDLDEVINMGQVSLQAP